MRGAEKGRVGGGGTGEDKESDGGKKGEGDSPLSMNI